MLVLGVVTVAMLNVGDDTLSTPQSGTFEGFQVVDQACVQKMEELNQEVSRLTKELESKRKTISDANVLERNRKGEPVTEPETIPAHQSPVGFKAAANQVADAQKRVELILVVCAEYPCIAVFEGTRDGFSMNLKTAFREAGFSWSSRWVVEGKSSHEEGARHFAAFRFYPKNDLEPPQVRYLERGLDAALIKGMDTMSIETSDN